MAVSLHWLLRPVFGIPRRSWYFACRGLPDEDPLKRQHRERARCTYEVGYNAALEESQPQTLEPWLRATDPQFRGFAFEGVALPPQKRVTKEELAL